MIRFIGMLRNILLVSWRNFHQNKFFTLINIFGLALGIAAFIVISGYTHYERSYDRMLGAADSIYRVESRFYKGEQLTDDWATSTNGYATAMKKEFPEIAAYTRISWYNSERVVRYGTVKYREAHVCFADSNFCRFFNYPLVKGDPSTALKEVNTLILSESAAKKYFGSADAIGKFLDISTISDSYHCMVTGVFRDLPANSTMQFSMLVSWGTQPLFFRDFWYLHESYTFVKLAPGISPARIEEKFPALSEKYKSGPSLRDLRWAIQLTPLSAIHLNPAKLYEIEPKGNGRAVRFLSVMAYIILLIACINYINLSTARAADRAREIGIRKVSGAQVPQLVGQFLVESTLISGVALGVALLLVGFFRESLPEFLASGTGGSGGTGGTGGSGGAGLLFDRPLMINLALTLAGVNLLTGIYPATVLARVKPIAVLKGRYMASKGGTSLRRGLVVFQFTASLLLLAGVMAVYRQIGYMNNEPTGVTLGQTLVIKAPVNTVDYRNTIRSFKMAVQGPPGVRQVTGSGAVPGKAVGKFLADRRFDAPKSEERTYEMLRVDFDFIPAYDLSLVAGRAFDPARPADSTGIILNEAAVATLGFESAEEAVGKKVRLETLDRAPNEVIGVVKNYHQQSMQKDYTPVILFMDPKLGWIPTDYYSVRITPGHEHAVAADIKTLWGRYFPESSFDFFFLDDFYNAQYRQDIGFGRIFLLFSALAIVIACMGLFGLTAHSTRRRMKEIGVRKVLGASVSQVLSLLVRESIQLVCACSLLGLPLAYLFIGEWLHNYAFRVELTWWQFVLPVVVLLLIALATIGVLAVKAAQTKPVKTLRED
jgi:putative ABC transport system permease protein